MLSCFWSRIPANVLIKSDCMKDESSGIASNRSCAGPQGFPAETLQSMDRTLPTRPQTQTIIIFIINMRRSFRLRERIRLVLVSNCQDKPSATDCWSWVIPTKQTKTTSGICRRWRFFIRWRLRRASSKRNWTVPGRNWNFWERKIWKSLGGYWQGQELKNWRYDWFGHWFMTSLAKSHIISGRGIHPNSYETCQVYERFYFFQI